MGGNPTYPPLWVVAGGNTDGAMATVRQGYLTLAGGNNITLSQAGNAITISAGAGGGGALSAGLSNIGNTVGDTGLASQRLVLAGGNNITLSGSTNGGSMTITISGGAGAGGFAGGGISGGNTAGDTGSVTGRLIFAGGNNITLSGSTNAGSMTITISGTNQSLQTEVLSAGLSNIGNTAGDTGLVSRRLVLAGGNNITLSGSTNGSSMTITVSAAAQTGSQYSAGLSNIGNTSGDTGLASQRLVLAGGNNITLSGSTNGGSMTITISGAAGGGAAFSAGMSTMGNTSGDTGLASQRIVFVGSNNITLSGSTNGGSMTITMSGYSPGGVVISGNTAGATASITSGTMTLAGGNNITISQAGNALTISAGAGGGGFTDSMWMPYNEAVAVSGQAGQGSLAMAPIGHKGAVQFDRLVFPLFATHATGSTGSATISIWFGLYSRNGSTLSLASSTSRSQGITFSGTASSSVIVGPRLFTIAWTTTIPEGRYWAAVISRTTSGGANMTLSQFVISQMTSSAFSGHFGSGSNSTVQWPLGMGHYTVTTSAFPASVAFSQMIGSATAAGRAPSWHAISGSA